MLTTPHALLGIYLASHLNPWIALPAALISHYLFDFFYPHWNPHLFTEMKKKGKLSKQTLRIILIDTFTAISFLIYFSYKIYPNIHQIIILFAGAFLAILPDLLEIPFYFLKSKNKFIQKIVTFEHHHQAKANLFWGSFSQIIVITLCVWQLL